MLALVLLWATDVTMVTVGAGLVRAETRQGDRPSSGFVNRPMHLIGVHNNADCVLAVRSYSLALHIMPAASWFALRFAMHSMGRETVNSHWAMNE